MPYYPTFAFFEERQQTREIAQSVVISLGDLLKDTRFEVKDIPESQTLSFENPEKALLFLKQKDIEIARFWLASDLQSLEFIHLPEGDWAVDFWDFDAEVYDSGGPTESMRLAKRKVAFILHRALIESCGAWLSYTSRADDRYCGCDDHFETAHRIFEALRGREFHTIARLLKRPGYFWLVSLRKGTALVKALAEELQAEFDEIGGGRESALFEHQVNRPYFLW